VAFQIGSSLLDACVLSVLDSGDAYGYQLTQQIRALFDISESTLYPVLRRLQKEGALETYDEPYQGRNRRYYRLTGKGRGLSEEYCREWMQFREKIDGFLAKREQHDKE
jgi:PadR family transcriptional regulator PadR